jgi:hypothetical protein
MQHIGNGFPFDTGQKTWPYVLFLVVGCSASFPWWWLCNRMQKVEAQNNNDCHSDKPTRIHVPFCLHVSPHLGLFMDTHGLFQPRHDAVPVLHPELRHLGRLWMDHSMLQCTNGLWRWLWYGENARLPSICLLQQNGRCWARLRCNQIHIREEFVEAINIMVRSLKDQDTCCAFHGDPASCYLPEPDCFLRVSFRDH